MLTALALAGAFAGVAGIALGDFTDCGDGPHGVPIDSVLTERFTALGLPTVYGFPFGHGDQNTPLPFGVDARLDTEARTLTLG
jgi:muramoyltetrapeptide carboxypeptidase